MTDAPKQANPLGTITTIMLETGYLFDLYGTQAMITDLITNAETEGYTFIKVVSFAPAAPSRSLILDLRIASIIAVVQERPTPKPQPAPGLGVWNAPGQGEEPDVATPVPVIRDGPSGADISEPGDLEPGRTIN